MSIKIDYISDLHVDHWNKKYNIKYPCGAVENNPLNMENFKNSKSKILIVAGDISDDLELSIKKLKEISKYYDKVLFVDGNHEHINSIPFLYDKFEINNMVKKIDISNNKLHYLTISPYIIGSTLIIGNCGWWDYNNSDNKTIEENVENYFTNWIELSEKNSKIYCDFTTKNSIIEHNDLKECIKFYNYCSDIKNIIIVTHTVPLEIFSKNLNMGVMGNTKNINLLKYSNKITHWIFGHTHTKYNYNYNGIQFLSNPRGRPEDKNDEIYNVNTIEIE